MRDYYYILGVKPTETDIAIKSAYHKLSKKFHPDINPGDLFFEDRFKDIQTAYETLSNSLNRELYDIKLTKYNFSASDSVYLRKYEEELKKKYEEEIKKREEEIKRKYMSAEEKVAEELEKKKQVEKAKKKEQADKKKAELKFLFNEVEKNKTLLSNKEIELSNFRKKVESIAEEIQNINYNIEDLKSKIRITENINIFPIVKLSVPSDATIDSLRNDSPLLMHFIKDFKRYSKEKGELFVMYAANELNLRGEVFNSETIEYLNSYSLEKGFNSFIEMLSFYCLKP